MRAVVRDVGVPDADADDVVHEAIASLQQAQGGHVPVRGRVETFLYAVARNHARHYFRQVRARERRKEDAASLLDGDGVEVSAAGDPEEEVLYREARRVIDTALLRMPQERRDVYEYRHVRELSWEEIGERVGISESTARRQYIVALRELKAAYQRWVDGKAYALPFPLFMALSLGERCVPDGALLDAANDVDERDASRLADASTPSQDPSVQMPGAHAPSRDARRADHPRERAGMGALLQRVWRSRVTHQLLGSVATLIALFLFHPFNGPGAPPPGAPPPGLPPGPTAEERSPTSSEPALASGPRAGASSSTPDAPAAALPSLSASARVPPVDLDAADRNLLNAAILAISKGRREEALDLLDRHARHHPSSKRSAQRAMLIAQLSNGDSAAPAEGARGGAVGAAARAD